MADEAGTRTRRRRCTALTLAVALLAPSTAAADRLRTIDVATGATTVLASSPNLEWIDRPCWAPDGRIVALEYRSTRRSLQRRYVAYGPTGGRTILGRASRFTTHAALAPGCARVAERRRRMPLGGRGVMVRDLSGAPLAELTGAAPHGGAQIAWSRDGAAVADVVRAGAYDAVLRVTEPTGRGRVAEAPLAADDPTFSRDAFAPDGQSVAVVRGVTGSQLGDATIVDLTAGSTRSLFSTETLVSVAWAPRGDRLAAIVDQDLHLLDVADGRDLGLVAPGGRVHAMAWSPDGGQIAFTTHRRSGTTHYVVAADPGAPHRRVFTSRALSSTPLAWSPDGTRIAVGGG